MSSKRDAGTTDRPKGEPSDEVIGSAPRARAPERSAAPSRSSVGSGELETAPAEAPAEGGSGSAVVDRQRRVTALVDALTQTFIEQVRRALGVQLDGSRTSLAFVDHYLSLAREEEREPIVSLLAAGAGAYFGELVRREMGGTWVGDGQDPRRLRLLVEPQFIHFSPVDQAYEAIAGQGVEADDPRLAPGPAFDSAFGLRPPQTDEGDEPEPGQDEADWLSDRLAELSPVPEDEFYSLTCRFETLELMLELLAAKHVSEGQAPRRLGLADYVAVLSGSGVPSGRAIH